jgi:hypothetical protein
MFQTSGRLAELQLQHRHNDGSWSPLQPAHHDPSSHDPERDWLNGQIYVCTDCGEEVRITTRDSVAADGDAT